MTLTKIEQMVLQDLQRSIERKLALVRTSIAFARRSPGTLEREARLSAQVKALVRVLH